MGTAKDCLRFYVYHLTLGRIFSVGLNEFLVEILLMIIRFVLSYDFLGG